MEIPPVTAITGTPANTTMSNNCNQAYHRAAKRPRCYDTHQHHSTVDNVPTLLPREGASSLANNTTWNRSSRSSSNNWDDEWDLSDLFGGGLQSPSFYSFRLEHRQGGTLSRHPGEERILVFRSDRPGAIAKIIYSIPLLLSLSPSSPSSPWTNQEQQQPQQQGILPTFTEARIHVLDVKESYRGRDLGGLLFSKAMAIIKHYYQEVQNVSTLPFSSSSTISSCRVQQQQQQQQRCQFEAEENCARQNKLVRFYESLGCVMKPHVKVQYIHHDNGDVYRKIPMQFVFSTTQSSKSTMTASSSSPSLQSSSSSSSNDDCSTLVNDHDKDLLLSVILWNGRPFLPVTLVGPHGKLLLSDGLLVHVGRGNVELHHTRGRCFRAYSNGSIQLEDCRGRQNSKDEKNQGQASSQFHLVKLTADNNNNKNNQEKNHGSSWIFQNVQHGTFLTLDKHQTQLCCSTVPIVWQVDVIHSTLTCTTETWLQQQQQRRRYRSKQTQTAEYAHRMRHKYLQFELCRMTLQEALLQVAGTVQAYPPVDGDATTGCGWDTNPSVRSLCFATAEWFRQQGHPDWLQLIALLYHLGRIVQLLDDRTDETARVDDLDSRYDWTISSPSDMVGHDDGGQDDSVRQEKNIARRNFCHDSKINVPYDAHCGLDQVLLSWSGPAYMFELCRYNQIDVPEEGLAMMRLASWNALDENIGMYLYLANQEDADMLPLVRDFAHAMKDSTTESMHGVELDELTCHNLWDTHYHVIAEKYGAGGVWKW